MPTIKSGAGTASDKNAGKHHISHSPANAGSARSAKHIGRCCYLLLPLLAMPAFAITEAQFIEKVLAQDKLLEEAQIGLDIKQIELDTSRDNYVNWKAELSVRASYNRVNDKQVQHKKSNGSRNTSPYSRINKYNSRNIGLGFNKRFLSNPASVSFGMNHGEAQTRLTRYKADDYYGAPSYGGSSSFYYAQINYPLLKHDGNAESLKTHRRDIHDLSKQKLSFLETKEDFLNARLDDYLLWVMYHHHVQINEDLLRELRQLQPSDEAEIALLDSVIAQTENFKLDAQIQMQSMVERLAILLDDATLINETPVYNLQKRVPLLSENTRDYLAHNSRALARINLDMKLNKLEIDYHENRLLPSLNLILRGEKEYDRSGTMTKNYDDDTTRYNAALEFSYPLGGSISTKSELAKRSLTTRRLEITYAERMENIEGDLQRLRRLLDFNEQRSQDAIDAAEQSTRLEQQKYDQTRESIRDLVQAHRDTLATKLDHIDSIIEYQMHSMEYDNLLDRIIVNN